MSELTIDFRDSPTVYSAVTSDSFVTAVLGPVGSGKSVGGVAWLLKIAFEQEPAPNNIRYTRIAVTRNTTPELKSTTIKTVTENIPESRSSRVIYSSPITYHIRKPPNPLTREPGIDCEILFVALDRPKDVRKLLSLELTAAWCNEAREQPRQIIDALTERLGRYPLSEDKGRCTRRQIYLDTNAPDEDSWFFEAFEVEPGERRVKIDGVWHNFNWTIHKQPPAVLEVETTAKDGIVRSIEPGFIDMEFDADETMQVAGKTWVVNPGAENLARLVPGYYHQQMANKTLDHIQCYQQAKYVYVQEGKPVIPEFSAQIMVRDIKPLRDQPIGAGIDIGGGTLNPATIIGQRHPRGVYLIHDEVVGTDLGVENYIKIVKNRLTDSFAEWLRPDGIDGIWLDPASEKRDELFEVKVASYVRAEGLPARSAATNDKRARIDAIKRPMGRLVDGKPGIIIHPRCKTLIKALSGAWKFRRLQIAGQEKYSEEPDKSHPYSDVAEALGYYLVGKGEHRVKQFTPTANQGQQAKYKMDFDVFG